MKVSAIALFLGLSLMSAAQVPESPQPQSQCVDHGRPCSKFVERMVGQYPTRRVESKIRGGQECWLEDRGGVEFERCRKLVVIPPARLWTFRKLDAPRLHPDRVSWALFIASHAALGIAYATCDHRIESPHSEVPAIAAVTGVDTLMFLLVNPAMGNMGGVWGAVHYGRVR